MASDFRGRSCSSVRVRYNPSRCGNVSDGAAAASECDRAMTRCGGKVGRWDTCSMSALAEASDAAGAMEQRKITLSSTCSR